MKTTRYALIIDACYCGINSIEGTYKTLYDAILAARDWIDEHLSDSDYYADYVQEFFDNDFQYIDCILNIDGFELED